MITRRWAKLRLALAMSFAVALIPASCADRSVSNNVLFDFEMDTELDLMRWRCGTLMSLSKEHVSHGRSSLKVEVFPGRYQGLNAVTNQSDWSGYDFFCFDIYNPMDGPLSFLVWVDDGSGNGGLPDGDNGLIHIKSGWSPVEIPLERLLISGKERQVDFSRIGQFGIYIMNSERAAKFYVDYMRLVKR